MSVGDDHKFVDDPEGLYLAEVRKVPPLSPEEEIRCLQHVRAGDEQAESAGKRVVEANLHLVVSIAERYRNDRVQFLDLIVKGNDALMGTVQAFGGEGSFPVYAAPHIERVIADLASSDGTDGIQPPHMKP